MSDTPCGGGPGDDLPGYVPSPCHSDENRVIVVGQMKSLEGVVLRLVDRLSNVDMFARRTRRVAYGVCGAMVFGAAAFALGVRSDVKAQEANARQQLIRQYLVSNCVAANDSRHAIVALGEYAIGLSPDALTPAGQTRLQQFDGYLYTHFGPRDCSKVVLGQVASLPQTPEPSADPSPAP